MSFTIEVANFEGRRAGEMVPWVHVASGECPGAKRGREGQGINPKLILSILDGDQDHLRSVCEAAIEEANPAPAPKKSSSKVYYWGFDGENLTDTPMPHDDAVAFAGLHEFAQFSTVTDPENWKTAAEFGLAVTKPTPPSKPSAPSKPSTPAKSEPEVASGDDDKADALAKIQAARGQRVLSAKS